MSKRILSGIQPSGILHLGNYFGMMLPAIDLQHEGDAYYFIANYHALTTVRDPDKLREFTRGAAVDFLASGLDPEKATLFLQSEVPEVAELAWILSTLTPMGLMERCHSYKDKLAKGLTPSLGLFSYPALMAADILLYNSDVVPVGRDQKQHIEVTRDLALKFNEAYGDVFKLPEPSIRESVAVVPGIDGQKMSKSYGNTLELFLEEKPLRKQVMRIITDSTPVEAPKDPANSTIISLYKLFATPEQVAEMENSFRAGGLGYGHYKQQLFEIMLAGLAPIRERRAELLADPAQVDAVLRRGAERARTEATKTLERVRKAVGIR